MEPMDYTMDDSPVGNQGNQGNDATSRSRQIQCQDPSHPQAQPSYSAHSRDARQHDPVHDSSSPWGYQANGDPNTNLHFRSPYAAPPSQPWPVPTFVTGNNWLGSASTGRPTFGDLHRDNGPSAASGPPDLPPFPGQDSRPDYPTMPPAHPGDAWAAAFQERYSAWPSSFDNYAATLTRNTAHLSASRPSLLSAEQGHQQRDAASQPVHANLRGPPAAPPRAVDPTNFFDGVADPSRHTYLRSNRGARRAAALSRPSGTDPDLLGRQHWGPDEESPSDAELDAFRRERDAVHRGLEDERAMGFMRAALSAGKRLPTKIALASLETLNVDNLQGEEKTCIICYNEFGVSNPEGLVEQPTRLPKCKHIFGDKCIKKWFEDSDSCPYCRDRLPSEVKRLSPVSPLTMHMVQSERERFRARWEAQFLAQQGLLSGFHNENSSARMSVTLVEASATPQSTVTVSPYQQNAQDSQQMPRHTDAWDDYVPQNPGRYTPGDYHPDRRRQARGRLSNGRAGGHSAGRPNSVGGSARLNMQSATYYQGSPRLFGVAANSTSLTGTARRTTVVPRLVATHPQTPQNRAISSPSLLSSPHSPEAASPPVAVGSGGSASGRSGSEGSSAFSRFGRRSLDTNTSNRHQSPNPWEENDASGLILGAAAATSRQPASPEANSSHAAPQGDVSTGRETGID
ncbi:putative E3 ubiquitin-protein ligase hrd-1, partial [Diplocarpon rosae]